MFSHEGSRPSSRSFHSRLGLSAAQALARAHVAARGGNAALMYRLTQVKLIDNTYKNHVYALIQLQADAVKLSEPV